MAGWSRRPGTVRATASPICPDRRLLLEQCHVLSVQLAHAARPAGLLVTGGLLGRLPMSWYGRQLLGFSPASPQVTQPGRSYVDVNRGPRDRALSLRTACLS